MDLLDAPDSFNPNLVTQKTKGKKKRISALTPNLASLMKGSSLKQSVSDQTRDSAPNQEDPNPEFRGY